MKKKQKEVVRLVGSQELYLLSANAGRQNFPDSYVFQRFSKGIPDCLRRQQSAPKPPTAVWRRSLEISKSQSFGEIIAVLERPLSELTLTVSQVVEFCERYQAVVFQEKVATLFFAECEGKIKALVVGQENDYRGVLAYPALGKRKRTDEGYHHQVIIPSQE